MKRWLPKGEWNKISLEQKERQRKFRSRINYNCNDNYEVLQEDQQKPLQSLYNFTNSVMTDKESKFIIS